MRRRLIVGGLLLGTAIVVVPDRAHPSIRTACPLPLEGFECDALAGERIRWSVGGGRLPADRGVVEFFTAELDHPAELRDRCLGSLRPRPGSRRWPGLGWTCFASVIEGKTRYVTARAGPRSRATVERLLTTQPWLEAASGGEEWLLYRDDPRAVAEACEAGYLALAELDRVAARAAFSQALVASPELPARCARTGLAITELLTTALYLRMQHPFGAEVARAQARLVGLMRDAAQMAEAGETPASSAFEQLDGLLFEVGRVAFEVLDETALREPADPPRPPLGATGLFDVTADERAPTCGRAGSARELEARCVLYWVLATVTALAERPSGSLDPAERQRLLNGCAAGRQIDPRTGEFRAMRVCAAWVHALADPSHFDPVVNALKHPRSRRGMREDGWLAPIGLAMLHADRLREARTFIEAAHGGSDHPADPLDRFVYVRSFVPPSGDAGDAAREAVNEDATARGLRACGDVKGRWWRIDTTCAALYSAATHYSAGDGASPGAFVKVFTGVRNRRDALGRALSGLGAWPQEKMDEGLQRRRVQLAIHLARAERSLDKACEGRAIRLCDRRTLPVCRLLERVQPQVEDLAYGLRHDWRAEHRLHCEAARAAR